MYYVGTVERTLLLYRLLVGLDVHCNPAYLADERVTASSTIQNIFAKPDESRLLQTVQPDLPPNQMFSILLLPQPQLLL
jgi:hypothetical protein